MRKILFIIFIFFPFIIYCQSAPNEGNYIIFSFAVLVVLPLIYFLISNKKNDSDSYKNLNSNISNPFKNMVIEKYTFNYNKIKFTNEFLYKDIQIATAEIYNDRYEINIYPYFDYSGTYTILKSEKINGILLNTVIKTDGSGDFSKYKSQAPCFIKISRGGNFLKIYDENLVGIILKF